jgi:hypothetical protein
MVSRTPIYILACCSAISSLLLSTTSGAEEDNDSRQETLVAGRDLGSQLQQYKQTSLYRHPSDRQIFAANCESDPQWWGRFCVFHQAGEKIDWVAKSPPLYRKWEGHYIVSLNWWHLPRLDMDVLQVVTSTHMGNGGLWIFALEGHELRTLMQTPASGFADSPRFTRGLPKGTTKFVEPIKFDIQTPQNGLAEVALVTATVVVHDSTTEEFLAERTTTETWSWNPKERVFQLQQQR